ncbi:hypothetical protein M406DRAFT_247160 [Cryphonectria parasitica EP155]|uniref:DUF676 domain-containing protein n=1 Tax=Cryphonectria parasitica (strain ATCC 38755 / EP155) TaxID=660469 RepID=A0A9P4YC58_CRYP1|nr:uncharacterized protein M406DRAFT_247160 [Cryphonectria parasitica EP155]KAF3770378.1 hypothetical protein M406DRAFT_247160 [Cryphonectria parasitica EP155]
MKKTLLLCFIHGFKGGEETFGQGYAFTQDLRERLSALLPKLDIQVLVYPKYETRGDLADCVSRFRDWLQEKVIDLEVAKGTPSPTVEPSVRVVLCGHSMGGIVAAETVISLTSDRVIPPVSSAPGADGNHTAAPAEGDHVPLNSLMFPYVQAVLSFDTPYLGISPGVVAHGAETHYSTASAAMAQLSTLSSLWSPSGSSSTSADRARAAEKTPSSSASNWGSWGKMALYAGAGAALAGGAAAAYLKRDQLTEGFMWVSSHLEFVGCLARGEELRRRVAYMARAHRELGVGFGNLYTRLGRGAVAKKQQVAGMGGTNMVGTVIGSQRTFCNLPSKKGGPDRIGWWEEAVNERAADETEAHMSMFEPKENPGYDQLADSAAQTIARWTTNDWYESSTEGEIRDHAASPLS